MLVDIDFFDANGRWNPKSVVFCAAEDPARAKRLWTRCFRGVMALHGKLWAKNYLSSHFQNKSESRNFLEQIKKEGFVDNRAFRDTVAKCTLLYENLEQVASGKIVRKNRLVTVSPITDVDKIVSQYFFQINWKDLADRNHFSWLTLEAATNIKKILQGLTPNKNNDQFVQKLREFMNQYDKWLDKQIEVKEGPKSMIDIVLEASDKKQYTQREKIADVMFAAADDYMQRSGNDKIEKRKILAREASKKDVVVEQHVKNWVFKWDEEVRQYVLSENVDESEKPGNPGI
ncbi:MAG: hypothetical protein FGM20_07640 [Burkholderiaceae bacterium]|nr:hypothetical protein [Burkholderiaceae bacterium]